MMRRVLRFLAISLSIFFLASISLFGQTRSELTLNLSIYNNENEAINDAYVFIEFKKSVIGVTMNGKVSSKLGSDVQFLTISHISYEPQIINLRDFTPNNDTLNLSIELIKKIVQLPEVEITNKKQSPLFYESKIEYVQDYEFFGDHVLILLSTPKKNRLKLMTQGGITLFQKDVRGNAVGLYKDCFSNVHLKYKDSIQQLISLGDSFQVHEPYPIITFNKSLSLCKISSEKSFIIQYVGNHEQQVEYYIKKTNSDEYDLLRAPRNNDFLSMAKNYERQYSSETKSSSGSTREEMDKGYALDRAYTYFKYVESDPIYVPLFRVGENYLLFDHSVDSVITYDIEGNYISSTFIDYHKEEKWKQKVLFDEATSKFYTVFKSKGQILLTSINEDMKLEPNAIIIKKSIHSKLQIRNNRVFYLYRDPSGYAIQNLFVQDL